RTGATLAVPSAAYAFTEGAGTAADDLSGNGNRASLVRGASFASGMFGNGLATPGSGASLLIPASESISLTTAFTFEAWVSPASLGRRALWSRKPDDMATTGLYSLQMLANGALYFDPVFQNI